VPKCKSVASSRSPSPLGCCSVAPKTCNGQQFVTSLTPPYTPSDTLPLRRVCLSVVNNTHTPNTLVFICRTPRKCFFTILDYSLHCYVHEQQELSPARKRCKVGRCIECQKLWQIPVTTTPLWISSALSRASEL